MAEDPVKWIAEHIRAGIDLREGGWGLRAEVAAKAWHERELQWAKDALDGVTARSQRDAGRVETLDWIEVYDLPDGHPWQGIPNSPFNCHAARIERLQDIQSEWRDALPSTPKLARVTISYPDFEEWYLDRAETDAKTGTRSSREQDREAATSHFKCNILWDWINEIRRTLPEDHPYLKRGRPPAK